METKVCKKCGIYKELCEFNKDKYSSDGLRYRCRECTSQEYRNYYYKNKDCEIERQVNYQISNIEQVKKKRRERHHKKYYSDILYRIKINLRNRVKLFLASKNFDIGVNDTFKIVGCTPNELKKYIESKFTEGMSWENYSHNGWHVDHIIPLSSANTIEESIKLCHYTNLQPLWCEENYKKGNKKI
jgi:hypothetical protein